MNPNHLADHKEALRDAILLRTGIAKSELPLHPNAGELARNETSLLKAAVEACGAYVAGPKSLSPTANFVRGLASNDFMDILNQVARSATVRKLSAHARHRAICDMRELRDFKTADFATMDMDVSLTEIRELSETVGGIAINAAKGLSAGLKTYGMNFFVTRDAIKNDDINLIVETFANAGAAASRLEAKTVYGLIESNPVLADGELMFHVDHGNLVGGLAADLGAALASLKNMETLSGEPADLDAAHLVVAPNLELATRKMLVEAGLKLNVIAAPWLAAGNWYLMADPGLAPSVALLHLKGSKGGLFIETVHTDAGSDGVMIGVRHDFAVVPIGRHGIVKGVGA